MANNVLPDHHVPALLESEGHTNSSVDVRTLRSALIATQQWEASDDKERALRHLERHASGLRVGEYAIRPVMEASSESHNDWMERLYNDWDEQFGMRYYDVATPWCVDFVEGAVIARARGRLWRYDIVEDGNGHYKFENPTEVRRTYEPVAVSTTKESEASKEEIKETSSTKPTLTDFVFPDMSLLKLIESNKGALSDNSLILLSAFFTELQGKVRGILNERVAK